MTSTIITMDPLGPPHYLSSYLTRYFGIRNNLSASFLVLASPETQIQEKPK
jgi:hypothetical protein